MNKYSSYGNNNDMWIGKVPSHWKIGKLKFIGSIISGGTPSTNKKKYWGGDIPWLQSGKVQYNYITKSDVDKYITREGLTKSSTKKVKSNSVLIAITGATCGNIGFLTFDSTINQSIIGIEFLESFEPKFYFYYFLVRRNQIRVNITGGAQGGVTKTDVSNLSIPIPPLPEQNKIVSYLDKKTSKIDRLIQSKQRKIQLLKEKRTSLINEVVTKGLNPDVEMKNSGVEWYEKIPKHWMRGKLSYHTSRIGDGLHSTPKYVDESEYKFINGNNLINGRIKYFDSTKSVSKDEYEKHYIELTNKTVLLSINGTIGNLSFYNGEKVILGKSSCYINSQDTINRSYLYYLLGSDSIMKYFTFELTGTTIYNLSLESVRNTPIPIPPLDEQNEIVQYLNYETNTIDKTVQLETDKIDLLKEYKQSLISEVVTGKVNVQEEVEEVLV